MKSGLLNNRLKLPKPTNGASPVTNDLAVYRVKLITDIEQDRIDVKDRDIDHGRKQEKQSDELMTLLPTQDSGKSGCGGSRRRTTNDRAV